LNKHSRFLSMFYLFAFEIEDVGLFFFGVSLGSILQGKIDGTWALGEGTIFFCSRRVK
jgi:hypothetical protein